jgi:cytochrome P450
MFGPAPTVLPTSARTLIRNSVFREAYREASDFVEQRRGWSMWRELHNDMPPRGITTSERNFVEETVLQMCTFKAFRETGARFDAIAGMSLGDAAAGYASGALAFDETLHVMCETIRAVLCAGGGDLVLVQAPKNVVIETVKDSSITIVFQWSHATVWAVPNAAARQAQRRLRAAKIPHVRLGFDCLSHTQHVDVAGLVAAFQSLPERTPPVKLYSTLEGGFVSGPARRERWARAISEPANLEATWRSMRADGYTDIVYIGSVPADRDLFALLPDDEKPTSYVTAVSMLPLDESFDIAAIRPLDEAEEDIETAFRSSEFARDPYPYYHRWLAKAAVHQLPGENFFIAMGYDAAVSILKQPAIFSSSPFESLSPVLPGADAPTHTRVRRALTPYYTKEAINAQRPLVEQVTAAAISNLQNRARFDIIGELAISVPWAISCLILGVTQEGAATLGAIPPRDVTWADVENALLDDGVFPRILANDELSRSDVMQLLPFIVGAGTLTVRDVLSFGIQALVRHPQLLTMLLEDPSKLPQFVEELIRLEPGVHGVVRRATQDAEVGGVHVPAESIVWVWLGAANRDPARFSDPDEFVLQRPERHISFGSGPHFCLGSHLGRLEAEIVLESLIPHLTRLRPTGAPDITFTDMRGGNPIFPVMRSMRSWQFAFKS